MKLIKHIRVHPAARRLLAALATTCFAGSLAIATPYATSLTNNAGVVSFRLNQTTGTNDTVLVISSGGAVTNVLQLPSADPANVIARGLIVTNLGIADGSFKVYIKHIGGGVISTNSPALAFGTPRGIVANVNPASPYFGWVYLSNAATNSGAHGDGIFAFTSDLTDILGQGNVPKTGGYNGFGSSASFSPYKLSIDPDDNLLVCDDSDATANLISMPPLLTNFGYVLKPIEVNPTTGQTGAAPVGSNNVHGSVAGSIIVGSGASRVLYTTDEDYQQDPTSGSATEWNSVWEYDIGANPLPWSNAPNRILFSPYLTGFAGQNQGIQYHQFGTHHYLYANQRRSNPPQHTAYIVDLDNLKDPSTFGGASPYGQFWASQDESLAEGYSDDVLRDMNQMTLSPDGQWFAGIIASGSAQITAPDGSTFATAANDIIVIPITNGVPNLPARQVFSFGGPGNGRDVAFDAAHNLYMASSGLGIFQSLDIGESTEATTGSDGTFNLSTPATQVSIAATTPLAYEQGSVAGVVTITRTPEDIGNPLPVFYTITGTASNGIHYGTLTNVVTIAAGQTSTNISVTPIDDAIPELTETVVLNIKGSGGYSVGFPNSATVFIVDNNTPQLRITSLSTNIYERTTNDYAVLLLQRYGDTNVELTVDASNFALGGTAVSNVDYYLANLPVTIGQGVVNQAIRLIYPSNVSTAIGGLSIFLTNLPGTGYTVTNNTAVTTLTLKSLPAGTVLFSEDFESDPTGTNWNVVFATVTNATPDYNVVFGYDYAAGGVGHLPPLPPAPHSTSGDTHGLYMTVNKNGILGNNAGLSSGLNLYPKNRNFSGNFALRFDMYLVQNSAGTAQSKLEYALFGINHSGTRVNWFRNAQPGIDPGSATDGLWFDVDSQTDAGNPVDYGIWSAPTYTNTSMVFGPTNIISRKATTLTQIFKDPPYTSGAVAGGSPGNDILSTTPTWAEAEVSQSGSLVTLKINNTVILAYNNTNSSTAAYTSGNIMLGYDDGWDDIGNGSAGEGEACVIYDNVRVVQIAPPPIAAAPTNLVAGVGTNATFYVTAGPTLTGVTNYQWLLNGNTIPNATNASYSFGVLATSFGAYSVVVSDGVYPTLSSSATLTPPAPIIVTPPSNRAAALGSSPSFSVFARSFSGVTNYQWMYYGTNIAGTAATLTLANVQPVSFGGPYTVRVNDGITSITSSPPATLTLAVAQTITNSVSGQTFTLAFGTEFGPSYVVEYKTNLADTTWKPLATNAGTGSPVSVTDSLVAAPTRFYRVRLQ